MFVLQRVALTFDDGPWPDGTDQILELLTEHGVHATFFVWGEQADAHPELVRDTVNAGHSVQPHCWSHDPSYHDRSPTDIEADIDLIMAKLRELGASELELWRPPWGQWNPGVNDVLAQQRGLRLTGWTIDTTDYAGTAATTMHADVTARLGLPNAAPPVVLMHDCPLEGEQWKKRQDVEQTIELLRLLLADQRFTFGPQDEAIASHLDPPLS